jgi:rod shape-determining protein MreC
MLRRPHYIALGLIVLLTLILLNLPDQVAARLKQGIGSIFLPLYGLAGAAHQVAGKAADRLVTRGELLRQNEQLRQEIQQLRLELAHAEQVRRENDRLHQLLNWQPQQPWKLKLARVILRDPANWWRTLQIDLGSRDGLRPNMPVLTTEGLVGRVASVSLTHAQVVLLGDPSCKVAARVENETRDAGVIGSGSPLDPGLVEMDYLSRASNLKPGQIVKTSGEGGIFPAGLPIGKILDWQSVEYGLATVARVKLAARLDLLEEVWVKVE